MSVVLLCWNRGGALLPLLKWSFDDDTIDPLKPALRGELYDEGRAIGHPPWLMLYRGSGMSSTDPHDRGLVTRTGGAG